jgi:hypothetical protein
VVVDVDVVATLIVIALGTGTALVDVFDLA